MNVFTALSTAICRRLNAGAIEAPKQGATRGRQRRATVFEPLESRTHLSATVHDPASWGDVSADANASAYTFSLHYDGAARKPGSAVPGAEKRALSGVCLRASGTEAAMRPRRPNLVPSMGATPTAGAAEHPRQWIPVQG